MSIALDLKLENAPRVERVLERFAAATGVGMKFVVADQMRLWVQSFMSPKVTVPRIKKHGVKAVGKHLGFLFSGIPVGAKTFKRDGFTFIKSPTGAGWAVRDNEYDRQASVAELERVERSKTPWKLKRGTPTGKFQNWVHVRRYHAKRSTVNKHRRTTAKTVGRAKRGWEDALNAFASFVHTSPKFPAWVGRAPKTSGEANLSGMGKTGGRVTATNKVPWADRVFGSWVEPLRKLRIKDMSRAMLKRKDDIVDRFNKELS